MRERESVRGWRLPLGWWWITEEEMKAHQLSSPLTLWSSWSPAVFMLCCVLGAVSHIKPLVWGHFGLRHLSSSVLRVDESWGMCFGLSCWLLFPSAAVLLGWIQDVEMRHWNHTHAVRFAAGLDGNDCRHADTAQTFTPSYFSEAETSAAAISVLCAAVRDDDFCKAETFGSFCCRVIYEHQLFPVLGIPAMTTMWVGPVCGTDSWHSRLLMSHRPEDGSDSEQILGFSVKLCYAVFWMLGYSSCKGSKIAAQRGMCRYLRLGGSSTGVICV